MKKIKKKAIRILFVDDSKSALIMISILFKKRGFQTPTLASSGLEAIALIKNNHFDLIFIDICMPDISGIDTTRRIKQIPGKNTIPIILFSAMDTATIRLECRKAGANDFLVLPAKNEDYMEKIKSCVDLED